MWGILTKIILVISTIIQEPYFLLGGYSPNALGESLANWALPALYYNVGAVIIRMGFGGILYYSYDKEPPKPYSKY